MYILYTPWLPLPLDLSDMHLLLLRYDRLKLLH